MVARLGNPDASTPDVNGNYVLYYAARGLVVYLGQDADHALQGYRLGGGPPQPDINGNVH